MKFKILSLVLVIALLAMYGVLTVSAVPGDTNDDETAFMIDDFNRKDLYDVRVSTKGDGTVFWYQNNPNLVFDANGGVPIVNNVLEITFKKDGWFAGGFAMNTKEYNYLVFKIKGEKGGEEKNMTLKFGDGGYNKEVLGNNLSEFVTADGTAPVITTEFKTIAIDMNKSKIKDASGNEKDMIKDFLGIHLNFFTEGKIYIDEIYLATKPTDTIVGTELTGEATTAAVTTSGTGEETTAAETTVAETTAAETTAAETTAVTTEAQKTGSDNEPVSTDAIIFYSLLGASALLAIAGGIYAKMKK